MEDAARESGGVRVPAGSVRPLRRALGALESRVRDAFGSGGGKEAAWLDMRDGVYVRPRGVGPPRRKATSRLLLLRAIQNRTGDFPQACCLAREMNGLEEWELVEELVELLPVLVAVALRGTEPVRGSVEGVILHQARQSGYFALLAFWAVRANSDAGDPTGERLAREIRGAYNAAREWLAAHDGAEGTSEAGGAALGAPGGSEDGSDIGSEDAPAPAPAQEGEGARGARDGAADSGRSAGIGRGGAPGEEELDHMGRRLAFAESLTRLADWVVGQPRAEIPRLVRQRLEELNEGFTGESMVPTEGDGHVVVNILADETHVFQTASNAPILIYLELVDAPGGDVFYREDGVTAAPRAGDGGGVAELYDVELMDLPEELVMDGREGLGGAAQGEPSVGGGPLLIPSRCLLRPGLRHSLEAAEDDQLWLIRSGPEHARQRRGSVLVPPKVGSTADELADLERKFGGSAAAVERRVAPLSPHAGKPGWRVANLIVKANDDLRQEQIGQLLVSTFDEVFCQTDCGVWLSPYRTYALTATSGLVQPAPNTQSLSSLKRYGPYGSLLEFFHDRFGGEGSASFKAAQQNYIESLAGYSVVSFLLRLHDRHNGNILIDQDGHIMHIDFGFFLGKGHRLELAPFKLSHEMVAVMGGQYSKKFAEFRRLCERAFLAAHFNYEQFVTLVSLLQRHTRGHECFSGGPRLVDDFRERFLPNASKKACRAHINKLIDTSLRSMSSRCYDCWQMICHGIR